MNFVFFLSRNCFFFLWKQECDKSSDNAYIGQRLAHLSSNQYSVNDSPKQRSGYYDMELYLDSNSSGDVVSKESMPPVNRQKATNVTLSPDSIEYDSNSGDLESLNDINCQVDQNSLFSGMPILEDGLSSGHASDTDVTSNAMNCVGHQDRSKTEDIDEGQKVDDLDEDKVAEDISVESTLKDIHSTLQRTKILLEITNQRSITKNDNSDNPNVWVRRYVYNFTQTQ